MRGMIHCHFRRGKANGPSYIDELAAENQRLRDQLSQSSGFLTPREDPVPDQGIRFLCILPETPAHIL
jgi:hypothetical protein